jgi:hypothetical protein
MLINRVVQHLENSMVETPFRGRISDIHSGAFSDCVETFQLVNLTGIVVTSWFGWSVVFRGIRHEIVSVG